MDRPKRGRPRQVPLIDFTFIHPGMDLTRDEVEFGVAMHEYQRRYGRRYPAWSEVLHVLRTLGYRKVVAGPDRPLSDSPRHETDASTP